MLESILVALDNTKSGQAAQNLAINLAISSHANVTGLALLHLPQPITPRDMLRLRIEEANPEKIEERKAALHKIEEEAERFAARCAECSVACVPLARVGEAYPHIVRELQLHDLLIIGKESDVSDSRRGDGFEQTVSLLLRFGVRPLIMTPPNPPAENEAVLVAYDGSLPSGRALQLFTLLGLAQGRPVHILSVDHEKAVAEGLVESAAGYLAHHGIEAEFHAEVTHESPSDVIIEKMESLKAGLLVVGAFGHKGWRETILGSSSTSLLKFSPVPVFVSS